MLQSECNSLLKSIYEGDLKPFGEALLFECNFKKVDINSYFKNKPFLRDILLAWNQEKNKNVIYNCGNEILWNNSDIRVGDNTVLFKNWHQSGIKYVKDIYNHEQQKKGKRKVQGVPQSQTAALPRPQEEDETDKSKQAQIEQTYEKH